MVHKSVFTIIFQDLNHLYTCGYGEVTVIPFDYTTIPTSLVIWDILMQPLNFYCFLHMCQQEEDDASPIDLEKYLRDIEMPFKKTVTR